MARKFLDYTGVSYLWQKIVAELNKKANNQDLATVATSGSYNDLINKPAIPTKVSDLQDDSGHYIKPVGGIPAQDLAETYLTQHQDISGKANSADLATVATSGSYNDLLNKPFIPSAVSDLTDDSGHYIKPVGGIPAADLAETYLTSFTETDPTVPSWAKAAQKPSYTAAEVGAPTVAEMNTAIGNAIGNINSFDMAVVQELPSQDISTHTIYLVPKTGETNDVYDEYVYINSNWEMVGNTQIDLSNYVQKTDYATKDSAGVVKYHENLGIAVTASGLIAINPASSENVKSGGSGSKPIVPAHQHESAFYGLAKAAGDTTQSQSNNTVGTYTTEAKAAILSMLGAAASSDIPDTSIYATKADTVLTTTLSRGRKANTTVGEGSFAFGLDVEASGLVSFAEGGYNIASGIGSHAGGQMSRALGPISYVYGSGVVAYGFNSFAIGNYTIADGTQGQASGTFNKRASVYPDWIAGTSYVVGDKVARENNGYKCIQANSDNSWVSANWQQLCSTSDTAILVGNGTSPSARSNAYALEWNGTAHYAGDVYVGANADSTGGTRLATVTEVAAKLDATEAGLKVVRLI